MRSLVKPFVLGFSAFATLALVLVLALGIVAEERGWASLRIAAGPLELLNLDRTGRASETTFGPGLVVVSLAGGLLNAAGALLLERLYRRAR